ncbi:MAG: division/cell wall cluster transcriptional repressor MraZ [Spirochaetota bacterium]|nr:division/cell wall cluster transcriptional repressor MraZ [Spirochaetota bacterium]
MESPNGTRRIDLFSGENLHTLDEKSRLAVPARFRGYASWIDGRELWVVTKGIEACLYLFTAEAWQEMLQDKLAGLSMGNREHRIFQRKFIGPAVELAADKQGRILIPQVLCDYASITRDCVVVGVGRRIEIWDKDAYERDLRENGDLDAIGDTLSRLDL